MEENQFNIPSEEPVPLRREVAKKKKARGVSVGAVAVIVLLSVLITFLSTYLVMLAKSSSDTGGLSPEAYAKLEYIREILDNEYLYDIDEDELTDMVLKGYMYGIGDSYSEYFTEEEFASLMSDTNGEMQGIGISIVSDGEIGGLQIISVFPESPAEKAGLLPGDIITHILEDGELLSVASLGQTIAVSKLQGEAGTNAEFTVLRDGEYKEYSIERGFIKEYTVSYRVYSLDKSVGVISITSFDRETPNQLREAYDKLLEAGCTRLCIDVRNNPGGELVSVCTALDMLVPEGPVVRTVDKDGNEEVVYVSDSEETNVPIAVITNGNTASAGELFAACLRDYEKAVLVGEKTYGKGSMQTTKAFVDGTAFKYTYRYYCPPFSENYDGVGIEPDVKASLSEDAANKIYLLTDDEDTQLRAAVEALK